MMAEKPDKYPDWALEEQIDPVSGQFNRVEPPEFRKDSGWSRREIPPRQWLNWRAWVSGQWIRWIVPILEGLGTASAQDDDRYAHRANNLSDVASAETSRENLDVYSRSEADASLSVITNRNINTANGINGGGDLSEDRTLSVDDTVARKISSVKFDLGGDFAGVFMVASKVQDTVTLTSDGALSNANASNPISAASIPGEFRPNSQILYVHNFSSGGAEVVIINTNGTIAVPYRSATDGTPISKSGTTGAISKSYVRTSEVS